MLGFSGKVDLVFARAHVSTVPSCVVGFNARDGNLLLVCELARGNGRFWRNLLVSVCLMDC